jgi:diguanylate cyclase (GGDEF)-like protein
MPYRINQPVSVLQKGPTHACIDSCRHKTVVGMQSRGITIKKSPWQKLQLHFKEAFSEQFEYQRNIGEEGGDGHVARKRGRDAYRYILLLLACVLVPMLVHNLYTGQILLSVTCLVLLVILITNILLLGGNRRAFLSPTPLLVLGILLILLAVSQGQNYAIYWLYPLLAGLPVLLRSRRSLLIGLLSGALGLPLVFTHFDLSSAFVISFSMIVTWLVSAWLVFAVTEQSRRLKNMAVTDPLTGAYNRRYLEEQAGQVMESWQRYRHSSTMLLIDVDFFKRINDRYGHGVGDTAIKRLVEVISGRIRAVDTLCRFGGEEFVVLLQDTGIDGAMRVAEELRALVETAKILPEGSMTISIGVCEVIVADNVDHWFKLTDSALYLAKRNGRNRVEAARELVAKREAVAKTVPDWR